MRKRLKVLTVGCKANFADSPAVVRLAAGKGFEIVPSHSPADVVIINSCTVTHRADRDSRSRARRARRENPGASIVLTGCYAQMSGRERERVPEVDYWVGTGAREAPDHEGGSLAAVLQEISGNSLRDDVILSDHAADLLLGHRRTYLKIQDGCDFSCAYCVVPLARGRSRSVPEGEIVARAIAAEEDGAREVVLTGIHIGLYGADSEQKDALPTLVARLLRETSLVRIRLSSVEPGEVTGRLIDTMAGDPRVCAHLHVPLQSGCDRTLLRMKRPYLSAEYREIVSGATARIPGINLGADVMVGFPGETWEDFGETVRFLRDIPAAYLHVFPYSARPGTESSLLPDDVPSAEKRRRVSRLLSEDARMRAAFLARQVGTTVEVLAEAVHRERGMLEGRSGNYAEVVFPYSPSGIGEIHRVAVITVHDGKLLGTPV